MRSTPAKPTASSSSARAAARCGPRFGEDDLLLPEDRAPARLVRAQETELSREVSLSFTDGGSDYRRSAVTSRRLTGGAARTSHADLAVVTNDASAERRANIWLQDLWAGREAAEFALPPSDLALAVGDVDRSDGRRTPARA